MMSLDFKRAGIFNCVMNIQFDTDKSNEFYIDSNIMKTLNIDYIKGVKGKGNIAKIVTRRKAELVKNLNYRGVMIHSYKISKIQSRKHMEMEGKRKPKTKAVFQAISGTDVGKWGTPWMQRTTQHHHHEERRPKRQMVGNSS